MRPRLRAVRGLAIIASTVGTALAVFLGAAGPSVAGLPGYEYLSPRPGSGWVSPENTIVLRRAGGLLESPSRAPDISVAGSRSGPHRGAWSLSDDVRTWVFTPATPFTPGETVTVRLADAAGTTFEFTIRSHAPGDVPGSGLSPGEMAETPGRGTAPIPATLARALTPQPCDTMPVGYLPLTVVTSNNPDPGQLFISPRLSGSTDGGHLLIADNFGAPLFHRLVSTGASDFTRQPDGRLTYYSGQRRKYFVLDSAYVLVDSIRTGNGYNTDGHELVLLPNGHWLLMSYDPQNVDMSVIVPGGNPNATVIGLIIQELDAAQNVVFQWRSWDHFQITDMVEVGGRSLTASSIDYSHGNAIEPDFDGHLLISSRHMNEITKINRQTGDIIWRMGQHAKNNQFTFVGDPKGFSHQHDIRRLPNGNVTLYDNGNFLDPQYSRAVEYALDEQNLIATQVWEYRQTPENFGPATGSVRRRDNGATLINWGLNADNPKITDLHADGTKALELSTGDTLINTYRARRLPWRTNQFVPDADSLGFGTVEVGGSYTLPLTVHNPTATPVELTCFAATHADLSVSEAVPLTVPAGGDVPLTVALSPTTIGPVDARLYLRSVHDTELVAQVVRVTAEVTGVSGVGDGRDPRATWLSVQPNPGSGGRTLSFGLPAAGPVSLEIYDLGGRRIATPFSGVAAAGTHRVSWDAMPEGRPARSGIYFARLTTPAATRTTRLVHLSR